MVSSTVEGMVIEVPVKEGVSVIETNNFNEGTSIASVADTRSLHPESDWLWLWTELGWPAVVLTIVGIALLVSRVFPLRAGTNQGYRLAALIAALVALILATAL